MFFSKIATILFKVIIGAFMVSMMNPKVDGAEINLENSNSIINLPPWPTKFHAVMLQNRSGLLALTDLYYDFNSGRNLNVIKKQLQTEVLFDYEFNNGSTYYYNPSESDPTCKCIDMEVGILTPNWLQHAIYQGIEIIDNMECYVFKHGTALKPYLGHFITYYALKSNPSIPVRWIFYDGAQFDILSFEVGKDIPTLATDLPEKCLRVKCKKIV